MARDRYVECHFPIQCRGRDAEGREVLAEPVSVDVLVYQSPGVETSISLSPTCQYRTGGHGQRCKASHPTVDKVGEGVTCPYSADLPYALETHSDI